MTVREVTCPRCRGPALYASSNPFRPFCSERCKHTDWAAWAMEDYRVEASPPPEGDVEVDLPAPPRMPR